VLPDNRFVLGNGMYYPTHYRTSHGQRTFQSLIPGISLSRQTEICLRGQQVAAGLLELLVDFRSFDNGKQLALLDVSSNVDVPLPQISVRAGVNRRGDEWLNISGKMISSAGAVCLA